MHTVSLKAFFPKNYSTRLASIKQNLASVDDAKRSQAQAELKQLEKEAAQIQLLHAYLNYYTGKLGGVSAAPRLRLLGGDHSTVANQVVS